MKINPPAIRLPGRAPALEGQSGVSLVELLGVLGILGIALGITAVNLRPMAAPLQTGAVLLEGFLRQSRLQAMATTTAYRVSPNGTTKFAAEYAESCSATTWTSAPDLNLELPSGVVASPAKFLVCFSSRGISNQNAVVTLSHPSYGSKQIEVLLGGTTRLLE